jgi:adenylate kinase family enzyme
MKGEDNAMDTIHRVVVVGTSGSGKTTFAARLARLMDVPHVELDSLHWEPNWIEAPLEIFRERVDRALSAERWVSDGNYSKVRDIVWRRADTIVWLDYSLLLSLWRLVKRTSQRIFRQEELWNGNRESFRSTFIGRESLFVWSITSRRRHHRDYPRLFKEYSHLRSVRLYSPREAEAWLTEVGARTKRPYQSRFL